MRTKYGFTLVEALVTTLIFTIFVVILFSTFSISDLSWRLDMAQLDIFQPMRQTMDGMIREIRQAAPGSVTISNGNGRIDFALNGSSIAYYLSSGNLVRECPAGTIKTLAQNILSISFTQSGSIVTATLQGAKTVNGKSVSLTLSEKARMRNAS